MRIASTDGEMHYVDEGHGDPILFVHGTPTWSFEYRHLIKALAPATMHRARPSRLRPLGASTGLRLYAGSPRRRAAEFIDQLGLDRFTLVVHDFGGPIGLPLASISRAGVAR